MPEYCPNRKKLPCRPKPWYDQDKGFLEEIVLQCEFCKEQVRYKKSVGVKRYANHSPDTVSPRVGLVHG